MKTLTHHLSVLLLAAAAAAQQAPPAAPAKPDPSTTRLAKVDFRGLKLDEACRLLSDETGLNIVLSSEAAQLEISLYLRDVTALQAVESLCAANQLWFRRDGGSGIVRVSTVDEYERDVADLQQERTEYFTLLYPNVLDVGYAIRSLFGDRVQLSASDADSDILMDLSDRLARFDLLDARTQGFGESFGGQGSYGGFGQGTYTGSEVGMGAYGGGYGQGAYGGYGMGSGLSGGYGGLMGAPEVTGGQGYETATARPELTASDVQELERLLAEGAGGKLASEVGRLYQAPINVTIARRQNKLIVRTSDEAALEEIGRLVERLDVPTALVLLEVRILSVDLLDGLKSFFEYQWSDEHFSGAFSTGDIAAATPPLLGVGGTATTTGNLIFQYVSDTFASRIQALEQENKVHSVATPILLTANNEVSRLFVGREVPLNRSFSGGDVVTNESTTTTATGSTDIEFRPVGTTLLITPSINADRTVTLQIVQESSNVATTATILVPSGDSFVEQDVSVVASQTVSGTIVAQSELAVAFGGLIETGTTVQEEGIPFLRSIPFLGTFFSRDVEVETRKELVIVVRPFVLGTPADFEASSRRLVASLGIDPAVTGLHAGTPAAEPQASGLRFEVHGIDP